MLVPEVGARPGAQALSAKGDIMSARTMRSRSALAAMLLGISAAAQAATLAPMVVHVDLMNPSTGP
jgi:uncharacterized cupredoxin-like copper-binding protein